MRRSASLDFLRGAAALAVAIPHYLMLNAPYAPATEAVAILGVEVFFVLSGFVLAPQIVDWVIARPWRNLGVFLARRWMRTIPPYVVALAVVGLMTGRLLSADTLRYLFYVENLAGPANVSDYYPVAWSLAVEEWFYLLFAPLMFFVGRLVGRGDRRFEIGFAALSILAVVALRAFAAPHDWDSGVRRTTVFRIDSIVWGYLLYLALETRPLPALKTAPGWRAFAALGGFILAATALGFGDALGAVHGGVLAQRAFPYASALFGVAAVVFFRQTDGFFRGRVGGVGFWLGRVSYSAYLFHLAVAMALKPMISGWPILAQLAVYLALVCSLSSLFWRGFERPILAARPTYGPPRAPGRALSSAPEKAGPRRGRSAAASVALGLALIAAAALARDAFMRDRPLVFYPAFVGVAVLGVALAERAGGLAAGLSGAARALLLFALALPVADALYRASTGVPIVGSMVDPTYSYRAARRNPAAFAMWWYYYLGEWIRDDGIRRSIEKPDPAKKLPFVLVPGSSGRMFDTTIRINAAGFRGPEIAARKEKRFRIVALGESQTFGPTLRDGEKPWPELLQDLFDRRASCGRPVEIINAGTEAYTLENNLERMRRDVLPLDPDLVISTHGMNGLLALGLRQQAEPKEPGVRPRASALIGRAVLTIERAAYDWRTHGAPPPAQPPPLSDAVLLKSRYAKDYRELIDLGRRSGVPVALATSSLAVNAGSPRDVKDFYGAVFKPIDDIIAANAAHNRLVRLLAEETGAPMIDMTPGLDGVWDDDLFLDIVHFTERGNERAARIMFDALLPILSAEGLSCAIH